MPGKTGPVKRLLICLPLIAAAAAFEPGPAWIGRSAQAIRLIAGEAPARLPVPVTGLRARDLRDSWGAPRPGGRRHQGIDLFAPRGRAIVSTTGGIVTRVGHNRLGGRVVGVLGPGGHLHYYAHLETFGDIHTGQIIGAGTVIGTVGNSGNAVTTPPHLHYGIYSIGGAINPYPLLGGNKRS